ncbi:beta-1,4-glucuronyltransferase 1 [Frankliniella occidentalis]|uniref:Beta-1,4-glucuronyltransferase 1 n=1 Tax=Frankliniella occidentalis TaxID=133901 RepID=A0A9C6U579_FRAOC|nr:beta-1,4-glucuronyltransferase 1 [Frankliniella occidentalis]
MLARRNWLLRLSVILNVVILLYFGSHFATKNGAVVLIEELQASGRNLASIDMPAPPQTDGPQANDILPPAPPPQQPQQQQQQQLQQATVADGAPAVVVAGGSNPDEGMPPPALLPQAAAPAADPAVTPAKATSTTQQQAQQSEPTEKTLQDVIACHDRSIEPRTAQRGDYWVLYNYVQASESYHCWESVTYTTHADYTFLDNLSPMLERWRGPVSLAMYAPGTDFAPTLEAIRYARDCGSPLVAKLVTFHVFFGARHVPRVVPRPDKATLPAANCSRPAPWTNVTASALYKAQKGLLYPVNVGRNIAREAAATHYLLASDIELYPSPGVIPDFLEMIRRQDKPLARPNPKVFPLPIFELEAGAVLPPNKKDLVTMLKNGTAIPFHKKVCPGCHNVPKSKEWMLAPESSGLHVFHIGKRLGYFVHWEPIFIGTHRDPLYDERLSWEGKSDKMTQGYALCVLNYDFQILDNAFLVHKPGIKTLKKDPQRAMLAGKTNVLIRRVIFPELKVLYGTRKGCAV